MSWLHLRNVSAAAMILRTACAPRLLRKRQTPSQQRHAFHGAPRPSSLGTADSTNMTSAPRQRIRRQGL
eukprot:12890236-Prorocentrum_lima.AAC.1